MSELTRYVKHRRDTIANWAANNPVLLSGQLGIETDGLTTTPKFKIGDGLTAWNSLPYFGGQSTIPVNNALFVMPNGNDSTGLIGRLDKPFLTITAAQTAASSGDTIFIFGGQTYTDTGLGKDGVTYHYLGSPTHSVSSGVIYEISTGITVSVLGDGVFYNEASAIVRSVTSSANVVLFKCKSIHRNTGGASAVVCTEGILNVEASSFVYSDTNCATCQNGTLTIKSPKFSGEGSTFAVSGTGTIYSEGEIFVSSTNSSLRSALLMTSAGAIHHKGNITYSNPNSTSAIVDLRTGTGAYVKIEGNITATSYNATYGLIGITGTNGTVDLIGKIIGSETNVLTGSGAAFNKVSFGAGGGTWGGITGTLSAQTDLQTALDAKAPIADPTFTTKINTPVARSTTSGGLLLEASNGTDVGLLGAGNTANATWYGSHNYDASTASTIASFGASKTLESLNTSTYPSLTELSYVKGATSAIQTQLNAKAVVDGIIYQRRRAGRYYHAGVINNPQSYGTGTYAHDFLRAYPVYFPRAVTIANLATYVNSGVAATNIRIGIYNDDGTFYPGTLVVDSGDISTASGGQKEATVTQALSPGLYWFAHVFSSSSISFYAMTTSAFNDQFGLDNSATSAQHWRVSHTFGALPSTFTAGGITRNEATAFLQYTLA